MSASDSFITHWYFHLPNMLMAAAIYTLIGRAILAMVFGPNSDRVIMRSFRRLTDPILDAVAAITPRIVPRGLLVVFAIAWLLALRMAWFLTLVALGMRASVAQ